MGRPARNGQTSVSDADVIALARRRGRLAIRVRRLSDILDEIAAGNPVVVFQNLGLAARPIWHFAVAFGYDLDEREIVPGRRFMNRARD